MENNQSVKITDVNMPFMSMVVFIVNWAIASIPAMIILGVVGAIGAAILGSVFK